MSPHILSRSTMLMDNANNFRTEGREIPRLGLGGKVTSQAPPKLQASLTYDGPYWTIIHIEIRSSSKIQYIWVVCSLVQFTSVHFRLRQYVKFCSRLSQLPQHQVTVVSLVISVTSP